MTDDLITVTSSGLYCPRAEVYIDPLRPVPQALITHAHSDHARPGVGRYIAHSLTAKLLKFRLGERIETEHREYEEPFELRGVRISMHPAGHVPGSAQILLDDGKQRWVISGDFKREADGFTEPFRSVECSHFISESTFGLPIYCWQPQQTIFSEILGWWSRNAAQGYRSILGAYSLGKAQRVIAGLAQRASSQQTNSLPGPLFVHPQIDATNQVIGAHDRKLARLLAGALPLPTTRNALASSALIIVPPQLLTSAWIEAFAPFKTGAVSGWMAVRGIRRRATHDAGFVLSDHADFPAIISTIRQSKASHVLVTHGYTEQLSRYLCEHEHISALPLSELATQRAELPADIEASPDAGLGASINLQGEHRHD